LPAAYLIKKGMVAAVEEEEIIAPLYIPWLDRLPHKKGSLYSVRVDLSPAEDG
jgi:hypothetical protein